MNETNIQKAKRYAEWFGLMGEGKSIQMNSPAGWVDISYVWDLYAALGSDYAMRVKE